MVRFSLTPEQRLRLDSLIEAWEEASNSGDNSDIEALSEKNLDLVDHFLKEVAVLKKTAWMEPWRCGPQKPAQTFAPGDEVIPGFFLEKTLGSGGFGTVWKAIGPGGVEVAFKCVWMARERAQCEWNSLVLLKKIRHPHLLGLFGLWLKDGWLWLGSELAEGTLADLFDMNQRQGAAGLNPEDLIPYLKDAADGLDYLHNLPQSLVHGDVKPSNLLVMGGRCKVGDFGLVRTVSSPSFLFGLGSTQRFASPELILGQSLPASDQYSLALTYCHLRGAIPFPDQEMGLAKAQLGASPDLSKFTDSESLILTKALAKDPANRFKNCRELIDSLDAATKASRKFHGEIVKPPQ